MRKLAVLAVAIIVLATIGASYQLSANLVKTSNVVKIGYIPLALSLPLLLRRMATLVQKALNTSLLRWNLQTAY